MDLTNLLVAGAAILLSLILRYVPGIAPRFELLSDPEKAATSLVLTVAVAVAIFLLSCYSPYVFLTCTDAGAWQLAGALFWALVGKQAAHGATKAYRPYQTED